jgi:hypothetical protein
MKTGWLKIDLVLLATLLFASGCLFVPALKDTTLEGREVKPTDLAFLRPGQTTREEVTRRLGKPAVLWRDQRILVYRWVKLQGTLLWCLAGGYQAAGGAIDVPLEYAFLIKFDGHDVLQTSEIMKKPPLKSYGKFLLDWRDQHGRGQQTQEQTP